VVGVRVAIEAFPKAAEDETSSTSSARTTWSDPSGPKVDGSGPSAREVALPSTRSSNCTERAAIQGRLGSVRYFDLPLVTALGGAALYKYVLIAAAA
jgi:hypothetical protein